MTSTDQRSQDLMTEARECFLEADFEQAMTKFTELKELATKEGRWSDVLASETGMAEVSIQQKEWDAAAKCLSGAIDVTKGKSVDARDATRAHYMLGIAYLGQKKLTEAKAQFEAAQSRLDEGVEDSDGMLSDIQDRLAQTDSGDAEAVDEDDLMEIAMEFGVAPEEEEEEEEGDGGEEDLDEEDGDDFDEEEEEAEQAARFSRKRRAANGDNEGDDEDDEEEEDYDDEEEEEEEDSSGTPAKRARRGKESLNGRQQPDSSNSKARRAKADDNSRQSAPESGDEVSSSA